MKTRILTIIALSAMLTLTARAQVPGIINYQGRVSVTGTNFNGTGQFEFALVDGGNNASVQATASVGSFDGSQGIATLTVGNPGSGYTSVPTVTITDSTGTGAVAVAYIGGGVVTNISVTADGANYTSPTITIDPPSASIVYNTYWSNDGTSVSGSQTVSAVSLAVTKGLYSVLLGDTTVSNMSVAVPASAFANSDVNLRVWFNDGVHGFQQLAPDQRIAAAGYALQAENAATAAVATVANSTSPSGLIQGSDLNIGLGNTVTGPYASVAGGQNNTASAADSFVGGGYDNQATGTGSFVGGGGYDGNNQEGNTASGAAATVGGGLDNSAGNQYATVGGGNVNTASGGLSFVGGGSDNTASGQGATVGGGGANTAYGFFALVGGGSGNAASGYATVGGGGGNVAGDDYATVGGGIGNQANYAATVGGGEDNQAQNMWSTVAGGDGNQATGTGSFVGGGGYDGVNSQGNNASGAAATVGGGVGNTAGFWGTVGGGYGNNASTYATVGGGNDNIASGYEATVAGGNGNVATGQGSFVGGGGYDGYYSMGNTANGPAATVGGGLGNAASHYATVGGGYTNAATYYATVGGGYGNQAAGTGSFVGGGGYDGTTTAGNTAGGAASTVGGGLNNNASQSYATVGGGYQNTASGETATVGGGAFNTASEGDATVGGGQGNGANNAYATVPGGIGNNANGEFSFAAGYNNTAGGSASFALGQGGTANDANAFLWCDGTRAGISQGADTFTVLATGGIFMFSGGGGAKLAANATSWSVISDRNAKKNFQTVDTMALLDKLAAIPIQRWNYKWEKDSDVPHIGPMAQDFKGAFYPGRDDTGITTLEFDGVELAAIQGLNQKLAGQVKEQRAELQAKQSEIDVLTRRLAALETTVQKVSEQVDGALGEHALPQQAANVRGQGGM